MTTKLNIPTTSVGKSYWNENALYQAQYDKLYNLLVPAQGAAESLFGEVVRAVSRLGYEYYNNGNCNACEATEIEGEWIDEGDDEGYYEDSEWEYEVNPFYGNLLELLRDFFQTEMPAAVAIVDEVERIILQGDNCDFSTTEERPYVLLTDAAIYIIASKAATLEQAVERSPELPGWYKETKNV